MPKSKLSRAQTLTLSSMLAAMSVVIGILCKNFLTFQIYYRFTLENLPVIFAGLTMGPVVGTLVGVTADIVSCLCSTNPAVNPLITLGAAAVGCIAGLVPVCVVKKQGILQIAAAEALCHLIGQVGIKSIAKILMFGMPWQGIFVGLGFSIVAAVIETVSIKLIMERLGLLPRVKTEKVKN